LSGRRSKFIEAPEGGEWGCLAEYLDEKPEALQVLHSMAFGLGTRND
jgi:hypothetical protein